MIEVYFLGGPNHQTSAEIEADVGLVPAKIVVEMVTPDLEAGTIKARKGIYEESPFGGDVYLWRGWDDEISH